MPSPPVLQLEALLGRVHKLLWRAAVCAEVSGQDTLYDDLSQLLLEVERLQFAIVARGGRLRTRPRNRT